MIFLIAKIKSINEIYSNNLVLALLLILLQSDEIIQYATGTDTSPCLAGWIYSSITGKCYLPQPAAPFTQTNCSAYQTLAGFPVTLTVLADDTEMQNFYNVLGSVGNQGQQWLNASYDPSTGLALWMDGTPFHSTLPKIGGSTGNCLFMTGTLTDGGSGFVFKYNIQRIDCVTPRYFVCEHKTVLCGTLSQGFDNNTMILSPNRYTVQTEAKAACRPGFYRSSELPSAVTASSVSDNSFKCNCKSCPDGTPPSNYLVEWKYLGASGTNVDGCNPISCSNFNQTLENVESNPIPPPGKTEFPFGYQLVVNCTLGYVNYAEPTQTSAAMTCGQDSTDPSKGMWLPADLGACTAVRCNETEMQMIGTAAGASLNRAQNRKVAKKSYNAYQTSFFNQYDNVVSYQCDDGFFFKDRTPTKQMLCTLKQNSKIDGQWLEYQGTYLPLPPCVSTTCRYQDVAIQSSQNLQTTFQVSYDNGSIINRTSDTTDTNDYNYRTVIRFWCLPGYDSANKEPDQNISCSSDGNWVPALTGCIRITQALSPGPGKKYVPPAQDAPAAKQVGVVVIVILLIFLALIILLDLSTLARDIKIMRTNLINLRDRWKSRRFHRSH